MRSSSIGLAPSENLRFCHKLWHWSIRYAGRRLCCTARYQSASPFDGRKAGALITDTCADPLLDELIPREREVRAS